MARKLLIYSNNVQAGTLTQLSPNEYEFVYDAEYCKGKGAPLSPTLPISTDVYRSKFLFPFFANLLPEGANKRTICRLLHIDERDYFSLLSSFAGKDFIGSISVAEL